MTNKNQDSVNALRKGEYLSALSLPAYIQNKHKEAISELTMDVFFPLCAYELNETDINKEDITALKHMIDTLPKGSLFQRNAVLMHTTLQMLLTYRQQCSDNGLCLENESQQFVQKEWNHILQSNVEMPLGDPLKTHGLPIESGRSLINTQAEESKEVVDIFVRTHKKNIKKNLTLIYKMENQLDNIEDNIDSINLMLTKYLDTLNKEKSCNTLNQRKQAIKNLITICNTPQRPPDFINKFNFQLSNIEKNAPGMTELGIVIWLKKWVFNTKAKKSTDALVFINYMRAPSVINTHHSFFSPNETRQTAQREGKENTDRDQDNAITTDPEPPKSNGRQNS